MIKIDTTKGKKLDFQLNIDGGNPNELKKGRFILKCPSKRYGLTFDVTLQENSVIVDIPPLDVSDVRAEGILELISNDNQYYEVWKDNIEFSKQLRITVKEDKENPSVILKENTTRKKSSTKKEKSLIASQKIGGKRILYRTVELEQKQLENFLANGKIKLKPQSGKKTRFYSDSSFLINDIENISYGLCISAKVPEESVIKEFADKIIVDTTNLPLISEKNIVYIIDNGELKEIQNPGTVNE